MRIAAIALAVATLVVAPDPTVGATRGATIDPSQGPPGTLVAVSIVDTGPHAPQRDLVVVRCALTACDDFEWQSTCTDVADALPLGTIYWTGPIGRAEFEVPDVAPGQYYVFEVLAGVTPPCMPVGPFEVLGLDTAMAPPAGPSPITILGLVLLGLPARVTLSRRRRV